MQGAPRRWEGRELGTSIGKKGGYLSNVQYRIATISFSEDTGRTWASRSQQVLESLAQWGREGWRISRLNAAPRVALRSNGFCLLVERDMDAGREPVERKRSRCGKPGGTSRIPLGAKAS